MHTLDTLPAEILDSIIRELVAMSYQNETHPFGPTLRALSLVSRCFVKLCEPFRYRDLNLVMLGSTVDFLQHLVKGSAWATTISYISLPVYDGRWDFYLNEYEWGDVADYDELLALVVKSAVSLKEIAFSFQFEAWQIDMNEGRDLLLRQTLEASMGHKGVRQLRLFNLEDEGSCEIAIEVIQKWHRLEKVEIAEKTHLYGRSHGDNIMQDLMVAIRERGDIDEVTYHIPPYKCDDYPELPTAEVGKSRLSKLRIKSEACDKVFNDDTDDGIIWIPEFIHGWGLFNLRSLQLSPNLTHLEIPLDYLYLAVKETGERLDLHQLQTLTMNTATFCRTSYPPSLDDLLSYLCSRSSIFSEDSNLSTLVLVGGRSLELLELLLAKFFIPSLKTVSVSQVAKPGPDFQMRIEAVKAGCQEMGTCLHLNIRPT